MAGAAQKRVRFEVQQPGAFAVQLRLTPALLEALEAAQEAGHAASIRFGTGAQGNAITVNGAVFHFQPVPEESCDLLRLPGGAAAGALVGAVLQKLMLQRNIADERSRVRARAEEAERKGHERKAQLLDGKPAPARKQARPAVQRATTPLGGVPPRPPRAPTPPPQQLTASMLAAPQAAPRQPSSQPAANQRARSATPPPMGGDAAAGAGPAGKPMHKSASTGRLGGGGAPKQPASALVLQAARAGMGLRMVLIAMLSERQMVPTAVRSVLADVAARVHSFKAPSKGELERALKAVSEFKAPGIHVLYPMLLKELDTLSTQPAGGAAGAADKGQRAKKGGGDGPRPAKKGGGAAPGGKRGRMDNWTDDDSDAEQRPPAVPRLRLRQQQQASAPAALAGGAAGSPPSVGGAPGSSGGAPIRRSSSRGSDRADESWIEEHADRQPQPAAAICSKEAYRQAEAAFNAKYEAYFALHQLIEAHKKDCEALAAAAADAPTQAQRDRHAAELQRLHQRRGERAKRWDQAYRVLHQELSESKARMAEFVHSLQHSTAQQGQGPPAAPAAVHVK